MAKKGLKKLGSKLKKFSKSKVGKVLKGAVAIGATVAGVGLGVKAIKAGKLAANLGKASKVAKGTKEKGGLLKGLFAGKGKQSKGLGREVLTKGESETVLKGSIGRMAKKFKKSQLKTAKQKAELEQAAAAIKEQLGGDELSAAAKQEIQQDIAGTDLGQLVAASRGEQVETPDNEAMFASEREVSGVVNETERNQKIIRGLALTAGGLGLGYAIKKLFF